MSAAAGIPGQFREGSNRVAGFGPARTRLLLVTWAIALSAALAGEGPRAPAEVSAFRAGPVVDEVITALHQDRQGLLWIGTRGGLMLFDGHELRVFRHEVGSPESLAENTIRTIHEDRAGRIWLGTNTAGLDLVDAAHWTFSHHAPRKGDPRSLSHESVNTVLEDTTGQIWVGTQIGLNRCSSDLEVCERIFAAAPGEDGLPHNYVYALLEDDDGTIWVGTIGGGLARIVPGSRTIHRWSYRGPDGADSSEARKVFSIVRDERSNRLYVATGAGLLEIDSDRKTHRWVPYSRSDFGATAPQCSSLSLDTQRRLWVATWGHGLASVDLGAPHGRHRLRAFPARQIDLRLVTVLADREGTVWVGTWDHGLQRVSNRFEGFHVVAVGGRPGSTRSADVTSVAVGRDGRQWLGTWGAGLFVRSGGQEEFRQIEVEPRFRSVLSLEEDRRGRVWVGTMGGLLRYDPGSDLARAFVNDPQRPDSLGFGYVTAVLEDHEGRLWAGVGGTGLHRLRSDEAGWERFVNDPDDPGTPSDDYVTSLREDRKGRLWVGTRSGGLNLLDAGRRRFRRFLPDARDPRSLPHHAVTSLLLDRSGRVWVGTDGGGLARVDESADGRVTFRRWSTVDGLVDDQVVSLAEDDDGSLWVGTRHGMSRFQPETGVFSNAHMLDGLPSEQLNPGAGAAGPRRLLFGTPRGLLEIRRGTPFRPPGRSPVVVTALSSPADDLDLARPPWELERLEVPWGTVLSIGFAVLDFADERWHRYSYRFDESRSGWIPLGARSEVTFTNLDPGRHTLRLRGRNARGVWNETSHPLVLVVEPPFWMTWWFRAVLALAFVGAVIGAHRVRTAGLRRRNRQLEEAHRARERALAEVRASRAELQRAYDRLRKLTRRLEHAKEEERRRIARELHDEMGQALTAAKINLQLLARADADPQTIQRTADAIALLDRLIGHVRALSLDLRPPLLDELGLVPALEGYLENQSRRARLSIEMTTEGRTDRLAPDLEILVFRIVQEAVNNALRHASPTHVTVRLEILDQTVRLTVADDGRGFDVARAYARSLQGEHLGLLGIRERVETEGGTVEIESSPGRGTRIGVVIPRHVGEERDARRARG